MKHYSVDERVKNAYLVEHKKSGDVVDMVMPLPSKGGRIAPGRRFIDVYIGVGADYTDVMVATNHKDYVPSGTTIPITSSSSYLWVVLPTKYSPVVQMSGIETPMTEQSNVTVEGVTYKVLKSSNSYSGTFNITLL